MVGERGDNNLKKTPAGSLPLQYCFAKTHPTPNPSGQDPMRRSAFRARDFRYHVALRRLGLEISGIMKSLTLNALRRKNTPGDIVPSAAAPRKSGAAAMESATGDPVPSTVAPP
jgi:hypothetical protein